jgi:rubrerythrin
MSSVAPRPSLNDFAEQFDHIMKENRDLARRLDKAVDEKLALNHLYDESRREFAQERRELNVTIDQLRDQLNNRVQLLVAAKEKLVREEFERKFQELTVTVRQQRHQYTQQIEKLKSQMSRCICRGRI